LARPPAAQAAERAGPFRAGSAGALTEYRKFSRTEAMTLPDSV